MSLPSPRSESRAVITGASSGIGEHLARGLAARGHSLILIARRGDQLQLLADDIRTNQGVEVEVRACDLADREARTILRAELAERDICILCNNAGFATFGQVKDLDPAREIEQVELNAVAVHELTLTMLPQMLARGKGALLITGSTAGHQPMPGSATYSASKAFANTFSEALNEELRGSGVSCTLLAPGPVRTGFASVAGITAIEGMGGGFAWLNAERVANDALRGMEKNHRIVVPGTFAWMETLGGRYTPRAILLPIMSRVLGRIA